MVKFLKMIIEICFLFRFSKSYNTGIVSYMKFWYFGDNLLQLWLESQILAPVFIGTWLCPMLCIACGFLQALMAVKCSRQREYSPQSLNCLLASPLREKLATPYFTINKLLQQALDIYNLKVGFLRIFHLYPKMELVFFLSFGLSRNFCYRLVSCGAKVFYNLLIQHYSMIKFKQQ